MAWRVPAHAGQALEQLLAESLPEPSWRRRLAESASASLTPPKTPATVGAHAGVGLGRARFERRSAASSTSAHRAEHGADDVACPPAAARVGDEEEALLHGVGHRRLAVGRS